MFEKKKIKKKNKLITIRIILNKKTETFLQYIPST